MNEIERAGQGRLIHISPREITELFNYQQNLELTGRDVVEQLDNYQKEAFKKGIGFFVDNPVPDSIRGENGQLLPTADGDFRLRMEALCQNLLSFPHESDPNDQLDITYEQFNQLVDSDPIVIELSQHTKTAGSSPDSARAMRARMSVVSTRLWLQHHK